jgi:hypothetical protein
MLLISPYLNIFSSSATAHRQKLRFFHEEVVAIFLVWLGGGFLF